MSLIQKILDFINNNPLLSTGLGLSGIGILTFWIRNVPKIIFGVIKHQCTTEITFTTYHRIFYDMLQWVERTYHNRSFRRLKVINGTGGTRDDTIVSMGYGRHLLWYKGYLLGVNFSAMDKIGDRETEIINITKIGRSNKLFIDLIKEIEHMRQEHISEGVRLYSFSNGEWFRTHTLKDRPMNSIYIEQDKKKLVMETLSNYIDSEKWYMDHGIPYQLGILLYGPPGTGKSSLIRAIASYVKRPVFYLAGNKIYNIGEAVESLPNNAIFVIEDIDSDAATHTRETSSNNNIVQTTSTKSSNDDNDNKVSLSLVSLSELLNSIDGLLSSSGRILITTTNHIEKLDPALIRPGRIDIKVEIGYVNNEILKYFIDNFFPDNNINIDDISIIPNLTVATLQNLVMQKYTINDIIKFVSNNNI